MIVGVLKFEFDCFIKCRFVLVVLVGKLCCYGFVFYIVRGVIFGC